LEALDATDLLVFSFFAMFHLPSCMAG
jgi:hypothetical protein